MGPPAFLPVCLPSYLHACFSTLLIMYQPVYLPSSKCAFMSISLSIFLIVRLPVCLSACLILCLSVCHPAFLVLHLRIYLYVSDTIPVCRSHSVPAGLSACLSHYHTVNLSHTRPSSSSSSSCNAQPSRHCARNQHHNKPSDGKLTPFLFLLHCRFPSSYSTSSSSSSDWNTPLIVHCGCLANEALHLPHFS